MQDKLEKFISENRDQFDIHEPGPDLWKRIINDERQPEIQRQAGKSVRFYLYRVAAVLLVAALSIIAYETLVSPGKVENRTAAVSEDIAPEIIELMEAEAYYGNILNVKLNELEQYSADFADVKQDILQDFAELDSAYSDLKVELGTGIYNEEIIESMIENYRLKLNILEDVLNQLKGYKAHESTTEYKSL